MNGSIPVLLVERKSAVHSVLWRWCTLWRTVWHWWDNTAPRCISKADGKRCLSTECSCSTNLVQRSGENDDTWWYRTLTFFMTMQGVTPLLLSWTSCAAGNGRSGTSSVPTRTCPCCKAVNTEHKQTWMCWWCTTPSKHLVKYNKYGRRLYW